MWKSPTKPWFLGEFWGMGFISEVGNEQFFSLAGDGDLDMKDMFLFLVRRTAVATCLDGLIFTLSKISKISNGSEPKCAGNTYSWQSWGRCIHLGAYWDFSIRAFFRSAESPVVVVFPESCLPGRSVDLERVGFLFLPR